MRTIFSTTLTNDADGFHNYTRVMRFEVAALTLPTDPIVRIRATFEAGTTQGLTITNAYLEHAAGSGDAYDFLQTPVQLLWAGSGTKAISAASTATSDWATFRYNKTSALLIAAYYGGGTSADMVRYKASVANVTDYYKIGSDAATVNKTGYSSAAQLVAINKIEVETAGGTWMVVI